LTFDHDNSTFFINTLECFYANTRAFTLILIAVFMCIHAAESRPKVHSFDVFDTVLGRIHTDPLSVFRKVEQEYPYPGFTRARILAEKTSNGTLEDVYQNFISQKKISAEVGAKLRAFEIATEKKYIFPIMQNFRKIQDGDLLVSDTYYNHDELMEILQAAGVQKQIHLYATSGGKSSGKIWPLLKNKYKIQSHIGDNRHSDVKSPAKYKIKGTFFKEASFSEIETTVRKKGHIDLANLMRTLRLLNPYEPKSSHWKVWNEQAQLNVPILILGSLELNKFCITHKKKSLLFSARGCCHFMKIFSNLFPEYQSTYFHTSRYIYINPTPEFIQYVRSLYTQDSLIIDEHGSGASCQEFFNKQFHTSANYISLVRSMGPMPYLAKAFGVRIEVLNFDRIGSLISFNKDGPIRNPLEYKLEDVLPAHECIDKCLDLLQYYELKKPDKKTLHALLKKTQHTHLELRKRYVLFHKK